MSTFVLLTASGLGLAGLYFLLASGLSLIFGLMSVLNLAHGVFFAVGGFGAWFTMDLVDVLPVGLRFVLAVAVAALVGAVTGAVLLVKAALGYEWFEELWYRWPVCFPRRRLSFGMPDGSGDGQSKQGSALFYFGREPERFAEHFRRFGRVIWPEVA